MRFQNFQKWSKCEKAKILNLDYFSQNILIQIGVFRFLKLPLNFDKKLIICYSVPFFEFFPLIVNIVLNQTAISLNIQIRNRSKVFFSISVFLSFKFNSGKNIFDVWFFYKPINVKWLPMMPYGIAEHEWVKFNFLKEVLNIEEKPSEAWSNHNNKFNFN
jgi:hypothetical protein